MAAKWWPLKEADELIKRQWHSRDFITHRLLSRKNLRGHLMRRDAKREGIDLRLNRYTSIPEVKADAAERLNYSKII